MFSINFKCLKRLLLIYAFCIIDEPMLQLINYTTDFIRFITVVYQFITVVNQFITVMKTLK